MKDMELLFTCPKCKGIWLTTTMKNGHCFMCAPKIAAAVKRAQRVSAVHVVPSQQMTIASEANRGIKEGPMYGMLDGEARRL